MDSDRACDPRPTVEELLTASEQASDVTDALNLQIMAGIEALRQRGVDITRLSPLMLHLKWLEDHARGINDLLLPQSTRAASRAHDPGRVVEYKAACVLAFEV